MPPFLQPTSGRGGVTTRTCTFALPFSPPPPPPPPPTPQHSRTVIILCIILYNHSRTVQANEELCCAEEEKSSTCRGSTEGWKSCRPSTMRACIIIHVDHIFLRASGLKHEYNSLLHTRIRIHIHSQYAVHLQLQTANRLEQPAGGVQWR